MQILSRERKGKSTDFAVAKTKYRKMEDSQVAVSEHHVGEVMGKRLYIVRHAKAAEGFQDFDRDLTGLGVERTRELGADLLRQGCRLDAMVASDALRTRRTAMLLAQTLRFPVEQIRFEHDLYAGSIEDYFDLLVSLDNASVNSVMMVGHNPEVSNLLHFFIPDHTSYMQTAACACLLFETDAWETVFTAPRQLEFYLKP